MFQSISKILYELTRSDKASPTDSVIRRWIEAIASKLSVILQYTDHLQTVLVVRANHLRQKVRTFKGSTKKQRFLKQDWKLCLNEGDIALNAMEDKIENLEDEVSELQCEIAHASQDIQELRTEIGELMEREQEQSTEINRLKTDNRRLQSRARELSLCDGNPAARGRSYKPENEYSESHHRKLKRVRTENCNRSLSWLEDQGFVPTTVTMINITTG